MGTTTQAAGMAPRDLAAALGRALAYLAIPAAQRIPADTTRAQGNARVLRAELARRGRCERCGCQRRQFRRGDMVICGTCGQG